MTRLRVFLIAAQSVKPSPECPGRGGWPVGGQSPSTYTCHQAHSQRTRHHIGLPGNYSTPAHFRGSLQSQSARQQLQVPVQQSDIHHPVHLSTRGLPSSHCRYGHSTSHGCGVPGSVVPTVQSWFGELLLPSRGQI
jgi:hypothetical protein